MYVEGETRRGTREKIKGEERCIHGELLRDDCMRSPASRMRSQPCVTHAQVPRACLLHDVMLWWSTSAYC